MTDDTEWLEASYAAQRLNRTERQVYRYGQEGKVRTRRYGRRLQYNAADVEALAERLGIDSEPRPIVPRQDIMPPGAMLEYLRQRDRELAETQRRLEQAAVELGAARQELGRRQLVDEQLSMVRDERDQLRVRITQVETENAELRPWRRWAIILIWLLAIMAILALVSIIYLVTR